jgi:cytochrome P450
VRVFPRFVREARTRFRRHARTAAVDIPDPETIDRETIDLADPDVAIDPFPHYEALRRRGDVHFLPRHGFWIVLGYDSVRSALGAPQVFSNAPYSEVDRVLLAADPPRHTAVRRLLSRQLSPDTVTRLVECADQVSRELVGPELDVVGGYGLPISRAVGAELIGFDDECVAEILAATAPAQSAADPLAELIRALDRIAPRGSLYQTLLADGRGVVEEPEVRSLIRLLWLASTTTTERAITRCGLRLMQHEPLQEELAVNPELLPRFVEEVMRLHPPEHMVPRLTTEAAWLGGVEIPAGTTVQLCFSAANRDPARFDDPSELRLGRPATRQLAFGGSVHACIGAALARRVVRVAVGTLLEGGRALRPAESLDRVTYFKTPTALTPERLLVAIAEPPSHPVAG